MATVSHHIYSHYNPDDREKLEVETAQTQQEDGRTVEEVWEQEAPRINRLRRPAPQFVQATISHDEWGTRQVSTSHSESQRGPSKPLGTTLSGWYRSLTSNREDNSSTAASSSKHIPDTTIRTSSLPLSRPTPVSEPLPQVHGVRNKNNWFIMKAIQSEPASSASTPAPSLAEILARDPPPLPSEGKYTPPVWLEIGPSNKGFGILQRAGWNEGEALGPDIVRRKPVESLLYGESIFEAPDAKGKGKGRQKPSSTITSRKETMEVPVENMEDITELRPVDMIDLTLDSEDDDFESTASAEDGNFSQEEASPAGEVGSQGACMQEAADNSAYGRKALLTPIATVLKSDRLGIGLKAKTVGPYKASQKRVTHNAAALALHVRAAEESRRRRELFGRGKRGLARQHKKEEERRQALMAYLKSS